MLDDFLNLGSKAAVLRRAQKARVYCVLRRYLQLDNNTQDLHLMPVTSNCCCSGHFSWDGQVGHVALQPYLDQPAGSRSEVSLAQDEAQKCVWDVQECNRCRWP